MHLQRLEGIMVFFIPSGDLQGTRDLHPCDRDTFRFRSTQTLVFEVQHHDPELEADDVT